MTYHHLLPPNATPLEIALSETMARSFDLPVPIDTLWNPDACPSTHLPWLAWALSVDIWDADWTVEQKRATCRRSFEMHRLKGTLAGIRAYIEMAGSELDAYVRPPAKSFLGASLTRAEREAFLNGLPQIRIYAHKQRGVSGRRGFFGWPGKTSLHGSFDQDSSGTAAAFPVPGDAVDRLRSRAQLVDGDTNTELAWTASSLHEFTDRVFLKGANPRAVFCGRPAGRHFIPSTAAERIVTLDLDRTSPADRLLHKFAVTPKMQPMLAVPSRVYEKGQAPRSAFCNTPVSGRYFQPSEARTRIYDVLYLRRPGQKLSGRQACSFMGVERFGIPAFTGELTVAVRGKRPGRASGRFVSGFFYTAPRTRLNKTLAAIRSAKSLRDDLFVNTKTHRSMIAGNALRVGTPLIVGSFTRRH